MGCQYIIDLEGTFLDDDNFYFLLEFASKGTIDKILKSFPELPLDLVRVWLAELVLALEALHKENIAHRDLKPANVLLDENFHLKLCDFGEAKKIENIDRELIQEDYEKMVSGRSSTMIDDEDLFSGLASNNNQYTTDESLPTQTRVHDGTFVGTAYWIAPEMLINNSSGPFSDLWALGVIAYQMLTGDLPFRGNTRDQVFEKIKNREFKLPEMDPDGRDLVD